MIIYVSYQYVSYCLRTTCVYLMTKGSGLGSPIVSTLYSK